MQSIPLSALLKSYAHSLTRSEKKVGDYLVEHANEVPYLTVAQFAKKTQTSQTTILRFCQKLGFTSYQDFKIALIRDQNSQEESSVETSPTTLSSAIHYMVSHHSKALTNTWSMMDLPTIEQAIDVLQKGNRILFFGVGSSGISAIDAKHKFVHIGLYADAITDIGLQSKVPETLIQDDVVVGLSVSGKSPHVLEALRIAKQKKAHTIGITFTAGSPITQLSDIVLLSAGEDWPQNGGAFTAKIAQLTVLDMLFTGICFKKNISTDSLKN